MPALRRRAQHRLRLGLNPVVERQEDVAARPIGRLAQHVDHAPERVSDHRFLPGLAAQLAVERELEPGEPLVVGSREAEHLRSDSALRIVPALFGVEADAGQLARAQRIGLASSPPFARGRRTRDASPSAPDRSTPRRLRACVPRRARRFAGSSTASGPHRPSSLVRPAQAARRSGRRSCRGAPGTRPSVAAARRRAARAARRGRLEAMPRAPASPRTRASARRRGT